MDYMKSRNSMQQPKPTLMYLEGSAGRKNAGFAAGFEQKLSKNVSVRTNVNAGKDGGYKYGGYDVTANVSIPIGKKNKKKK